MTTNSSTSSGGLVILDKPPKGIKKQISPSLHWFFTFNNYVSKDINDILEVLVLSSTKYIFQEELGAENGTPHLQGYIKFTKKVRPKNLFNSRIHWEKCRNVKKSIDYCQKLVTRNGRIFKRNIVLNKNIIIHTLEPENLYNWELDIIDIINKDSDDRTIYWFWESLGNVGKSVFCKYLVLRYDALILGGKGADMKYGIIKYIEKHKIYPKLILIDIPRTMKDYISYTGIEEIKNACFFSPKYESSMVVGNCPHIICFSNHYPCTNKLSLDRWKIKHIGEEKVNTELDEGLP